MSSSWRPQVPFAVAQALNSKSRFSRMPALYLLTRLLTPRPRSSAPSLLPLARIQSCSATTARSTRCTMDSTLLAPSLMRTLSLPPLMARTRRVLAPASSTLSSPAQQPLLPQQPRRLPLAGRQQRPLALLPRQLLPEAQSQARVPGTPIIREA